MPSLARRKRGTHAAGSELPLYRKPHLYDVAFGFRDVAAECDGLLKLAKRYGMAQPRSVLELACGPAHHLRELARRDIACTGLDINKEMLDYARELCERDGVSVTLQSADMRTFRLARRFDVVLCLFDSFAQCISERDAVETLRSSALALKKSGLLFLEFTHPSDYFSKVRSHTVDRWTQRQGDLKVKAQFSVTRLDPVAETFVASMVIEPSLRGKKRSPGKLMMRWPQRMWLRGGIQYVVLASGRFDIVGWYGDIDPIVPLDSRKQAWRMIAVLRRH